MKPAEDPALLFVTSPSAPGFALADTDPGATAAPTEPVSFASATTEPAASISIAALRGNGGVTPRADRSKVWSCPPT